MIKRLWYVFNLYRQLGLSRAIFVIARIMILPFWKLDRLLPSKGTIIDIGCGYGGMTNYLSQLSPGRSLVGIDLSKKKINLAKKTARERKNIQFTVGDANDLIIPRSGNFLLVDVLHHIAFEDQKRLLASLAGKLKRSSLLIIKDVNKENIIPFLFGHLVEKILYPKQHIYVRGRSQWVKLFRSLDLSYKIEKGAFYFPDSTLIFVCTKK